MLICKATFHIPHVLEKAIEELVTALRVSIGNIICHQSDLFSNSLSNTVSCVTWICHLTSLVSFYSFGSGIMKFNSRG